MTKWERVKDLLHRAMQLAPEERVQFLDQACPSDAALRAEVESLLLADAEVGPRFLQSSAPLRSADTSRTNSLHAGQTISHYRIIKKLGSGGMGVVCEAEDVRLQRRVALKFLSDNLARDPIALQRFQREAQAASSLNHPGICTIYEVEEYDGQPVIVMELLAGEDLKGQIRNGPLPTTALLDLGIQTSDALAAAHAQGIIHRDIKPANIFMAVSGRVKILDFGIAKAAPSHRSELDTDEESLTVEGLIPGTAAYMSPEQVRADEIDTRSDLFSLGVVLYEAATGRRPFAGKNRVLTMNAILNEEPVTAGRVNPELPPALDTIIAKALKKDREQRYQSAAEMRADLQRLKRDSDSHVSSAVLSATRPLEDSRRLSSRAMLGFAVAIFFCAVVIAGGIHYRSHQQGKRLTEKDTIVFADFTNTTGDAIFDDTLKTALTISLRQSPFLNVLSDSQVAKTLQQMTRPVETKLTPEVAREVCQRAGSKVYLAGSIGSMGSEYVLGLKAVNCQSGDMLAEEQVTAFTKEKVLDALAAAASRLRGELGESLATVREFDVPLEQATTPSLEALKAYSLGGKATNEKGAAAALPYAQHAVELDPSFAMGYRALANEYFSLGELERTSDYLAKAFQLREHATELEKLSITADYYSSVTGELYKAVQTYQETIERYPRGAAALAGLGLAYAALGEYEKAAEITRQGMALRPDEVAFHENLANHVLALQRFDEARQIIHQAQALETGDAIPHNALYAVAFLGSDPGAMAEEQRWFAGQPDYENDGLALASDTEAYAGHVRKAGELNQRAVDSAVRVDNKENGAIYLANAALQQAAYGNPAAARQSATEAVKLARASQGVQSEAALAFAMAGETARAGFLAQELGRRFPLDTRIQSLWLPAVQAQLALNAKNPAIALNDLQGASTIEFGQNEFANNISCLYSVYVRGEAYLAAGQGNAAAAEFQKILDHSGIVWNCWTGALARLGVARANALESTTSQGADADAARVRALAAYKDFLTLWKDADPDIPILKQAKAEYAKLE